MQGASKMGFSKLKGRIKGHANLPFYIFTFVVPSENINFEKGSRNHSTYHKKVTNLVVLPVND
jgi:hypothetical protein